MLLRILTILTVLIFLTTPVRSGPFAEESVRLLDSKPYNPATDPNIDLFISSWKDSKPRIIFGMLEEYDIFTPLTGRDYLHPSKKGAVLKFTRGLTHASLAPGKSTTSAVLSSEQYLIYIDGGTGTIQGNGKTIELLNGVGVLIPVGLRFSLTAGSTGPLTMYIMKEPVPPGFKPRTELVAKDENVMTIDGVGHWTHLAKGFFFQKDGLTTMSTAPVWYDVMTIGHPHSHGKTYEEFWFVVEGDAHLLIGKQVRVLSPGSAFYVPLGDFSPHSNMNVGDKPIKLFWVGASGK
jgi:mannose-6-phosphate isomerase-like protein (cupin superfamily)